MTGGDTRRGGVGLPPCDFCGDASEVQVIRDVVPHRLPDNQPCPVFSAFPCETCAGLLTYRPVNVIAPDNRRIRCPACRPLSSTERAKTVFSRRPPSGVGFGHE